MPTGCAPSASLRRRGDPCVCVGRTGQGVSGSADGLAAIERARCSLSRFRVKYVDRRGPGCEYRGRRFAGDAGRTAARLF